jgi:hypothetical protein
MHVAKWREWLVVLPYTLFYPVSYTVLRRLPITPMQYIRNAFAMYSMAP